MYNIFPLFPIQSIIYAAKWRRATLRWSLPQYSEQTRILYTNVIWVNRAVIASSKDSSYLTYILRDIIPRFRPLLRAPGSKWIFRLDFMVIYFPHWSRCVFHRFSRGRTRIFIILRSHKSSDEYFIQGGVARA